MTLFALLFKRFPHEVHQRSHGPEFPSGCSINDGIPQNTYLGEDFKLQLPQIDRLVEFTLKKGRNCLVSKKDLCRAYCQFPIDPKDYHLLGCHYQGKFYFVTRPFVRTDFPMRNKGGCPYLPQAGVLSRCLS